MRQHGVYWQRARSGRTRARSAWWVMRRASSASPSSTRRIEHGCKRCLMAIQPFARRSASWRLSPVALSVLASLVLALPVSGQATLIRGVVFEDANRNGVRDVAERGVSGVAVSNQSDVAVTDSAGRFAISPGITGVLFVATPNGYRSTNAFWRAIGPSSDAVDFGLVRESQPREYTFVHASDPHLAPATIDRFRLFAP